MIYAIQAGSGGPLKIGYATDPYKRLRQLQTGSSEKLHLIKVVYGNREFEKKIHLELSAFRIHGEWFGVSDDVLAYLDRLRIVEYEINDGNAYLVLWREDAESLTEPCPFCGIKHFHGVQEGYRKAHCSTNNATTVAKDGTKLYQEHGYIVRTRSKMNAKLVLDSNGEQDSVAQFLEECCRFVKGWNDEDQLERELRIRNGDLYRAYTNFCKSKRTYPESHRRLSQRLKKRGLRQINSGGRYWEGIQLNKQF